LNSTSLSQFGAGKFSTQQDSINRSGTRDKTFQDASAEIFHRYTKTSTPIVQSQEEIEQVACESESSSAKDTDIVAKASKLCQYFEMTNSKIVPSSDTVDSSDKALNDLIKVSLGDNKPKTLKPHDIIPERLKKGYGKKVEGTTKTPKLKGELQKCLEEVLQSYVQQLDLKDLKTQNSDISIDPEPVSTFHADGNTLQTDNKATADNELADVLVSNNNSTLNCDTKERKSRESNRSVCLADDNCNSSNGKSGNQCQRKSKNGKHPWK